MKQHNPNTELPTREDIDVEWSVDVIVRLSDGRYYSGYYSFRRQEWNIYNFSPREVTDIEDRAVVVAWYDLPEEE